MTTLISVVRHLPIEFPGQRKTGLLNVLAVWKERQALKSMSDSELSDIGITRTMAMKEAARPFWDLPARQGC